ncbi:hypothetical protein [Listeria phage vB_Lmo_2389_typeII]
MSVPNLTVRAFFMQKNTLKALIQGCYLMKLFQLFSVLLQFPVLPNPLKWLFS